MYRCLDCGREFERPKRYIERHNLDCPPYEEFYGCPVCGGSYEEFDEDEESAEEEKEDERD